MAIFLLTQKINDDVIKATIKKKKINVCVKLALFHQDTSLI